MISLRESNHVKCKYCGAPEIVKCGNYKGIPRYLCRRCRRKFKDDDNAFHMSVPAEYVDCVLNSYYAGIWIDEIRNNLLSRFGYYPSAALVRYWIKKYTGSAARAIEQYRPRVGGTWVIDERIIRLNGKKTYYYDLVDDHTDFLLTLLIVAKRSDDIIQRLVREAFELAGSRPRIIMNYMPHNIFRNMKKDTDYVAQQVPWETFAIRNRIGILSNANVHCIKNLGKFRTIETAGQFLQGLSVHFNYFTVNDRLQGKTPAEAAGIKYPCRQWQAIVKQTT